jgi:hypothetical protein
MPTPVCVTAGTCGVAPACCRCMEAAQQCTPEVFALPSQQREVFAPPCQHSDTWVQVLQQLVHVYGSCSHLCVAWLVLVHPQLLIGCITCWHTARMQRRASAAGSQPKHSVGRVHVCAVQHAYVYAIQGPQEACDKKGHMLIQTYMNNH